MLHSWYCVCVIGVVLLVTACGPTAARDVPTMAAVSPPVQRPTLPATAAPKPIPSISPATTTLRTRLPDLSQARFISASIEWVGLAESAPYRRWFSWVRREQTYHGTGTVQVGGYAHPIQTQDVRSTVPMTAIQDASAALATIQLLDEPYTPHIPATDDYPAIVISFHIGDDEITFFTRSQGETHRPWACILGNRVYTVVGDEPYRMYQYLMPYLGADIEQQLIAGQLRDAQATTTP